VKVLADVIIILKIEVNSEPQNHRRKGYGSAGAIFFLVEIGHGFHAACFNPAS
jgi:hypothetical protein